MSNKYDAFTGLANTAANIAHFMDATAERSKCDELSAAEYQNRLRDMSSILRAAIKNAHDVYFIPDAKP